MSIYKKKMNAKKDASNKLAFHHDAHGNIGHFCTSIYSHISCELQKPEILSMDITKFTYQWTHR